MIPHKKRNLVVFASNVIKMGDIPQLMSNLDFVIVMETLNSKFLK